MPPARSIAVLRRWILAGAVTLACLVMMEIALRVVLPLHRFVNPGRSFHRFDAHVGWRGKADLDARFVSGTGEFEVHVRHDSEGFRLHEDLGPKGETPTWAVFGDSFTWGWGVAQGEVFTDRLQTLAADAATIRNFGINASSTLQQGLLLEALMQGGRTFDRVIVMFFGNDFQECLQVATDKPYLDIKGDAVELRNHPVRDSHYNEGWLRQAMRSSMLCTTVSSVIEIWKRRLKGTPPSMEIGRPLSPRIEEWIGVEYALDRIRRACAGAGSKLSVAYIPLPSDLVADKPTEVRARLERLCQDWGVQWIDLSPAFRRASPGDPLRLYMRKDGHWTAEGHQVAAMALHEAMKP